MERWQGWKDGYKTVVFDNRYAGDSALRRYEVDCITPIVELSVNTYIAKSYDGYVTVYEVLGTEQRIVGIDTGPVRVNVIWVRTVSGRGHAGDGRVRRIRESELRKSPMWKAVELA